MVDSVRTCLLALALLACGGKSSSIHESDGDASKGGSISARGGRSGSGGVPEGGSVATGGNPVGGSAGQGGSECEPGSVTSIVGIVRDPAGQMPLYNVVVYIPLEPLLPLPELPIGTICELCPLYIPEVYSSALTDVGGNFRIQAPAGRDVPLVIQSGKWRRRITVPFVSPCVENVIDDPDATRLPRSQREGNMARIAVVTGVEDPVECFLRRVGIADSEFTTPTGGGSVNLFVGCDGGSGRGAARFAPSLGGEPFPDAQSLFGDPELLRSYDLIFLGCEGSACENDKVLYHENIEGYADQGGRLFFDHQQGYWLRRGSEAWQGLASFRDIGAETISGVTATVDQTVPKGEAFGNWLVNAGASTRLGELEMLVGTSVEAVTEPAQRWLYGDRDLDEVTDIFSFTARTPVNVAEHLRCGRLVFSDFHALHGSFDTPDVSRSEIPFPNGCVSNVPSPQDAAIEFQVFDLPQCIERGPAPPMPPL